MQAQDENEPFYSARQSGTVATTTYALPEIPTEWGVARWVAPGEGVQIADTNVTGGMLYIGTHPDAEHDGTPPCLINATLPVTPLTQYRNGIADAWSSYADISPNSRRAYLNWLVSGRSNPDVDIGCVFLFFYGLERRVLIDWRKDHSTRGDKPILVTELRRLLAIYGTRSASFLRHASELLDWIELDGAPQCLYDKPLPNFPASGELPFYLRLAIGQAAVDDEPLSASLALAWLRLDPDVPLLTAAVRCPEEFEQLFLLRYAETFGSGLRLEPNRTKLKFVYHATSPELREIEAILLFGNTPDVAATTTLSDQLGTLVRQCTNELDPYSRMIGREPSSSESLESLVLLPTCIWPTKLQSRIRLLLARTSSGPLTITLDDLILLLGRLHDHADRSFVTNLARSLESIRIGMEPHVLSGVKAPNGQDKIVLFQLPNANRDEGSDAEYWIPALTLQLAVAMAMSDWCFSEEEVLALHHKVDGWSSLAPNQSARLHACIHWLMVNPPSLHELLDKLAPLDTATRQEISMFMMVIAESDGYVAPEEIEFQRMLDNALGIIPEQNIPDLDDVFVDASKPDPYPSATGFRLDMDRVAALQADSERVASLLAKIFTENEETPELELVIPNELEPINPGVASLGLDESHTILARLLLSRPHWTRDELEDAASDLDLLLDGALEEINEAAFAAFDAPLCEGDYSIDINIDLLENIEA